MSPARPALVLLRLYLLGFATVLGAVAYWQLVRGDELAVHPRNRRYWRTIRSYQRGPILAADGEQLAISQPVNASGPSRRREYARRYPGGAAYSHVVGYTDQKIGEFGVEMALNQVLLNLHAAPPLPRSLKAFLWQSLVPPERRGDEVVLTIDSEVQETAVRELGQRRGAVVAIEVATGAVLALADWPGFDPNTVAEQWSQLQRDEDHPLLARAYQGRYPPGSVLKVFTAAAALQAGVVGESDTFVCEGVKRYRHSTVYCHERSGHGPLTFRQGLAKSCNIVFGEVALALGGSRFESTARAAWLADRPQLFYPGDDRLGLVGRGSLPAALPAEMLAASGYGQGEMLVTPLWVAMLGQMVGNGGRLLEPRVVKAIHPRTGSGYALRPEPGRVVVSPEAARVVLSMMGDVMRPGGTAAHLGVPGVRVAGKTGSAENPHGQAHSWFLALAPAEAPRVAVAVVVENGGYGGRAAGPVA
ncbi:MAG: cell division protein FtsI, partial [Armatimonadetes bacterium]|nr:cell division protein FtsI [Armatimonadota bacterium]